MDVSQTMRLLDAGFTAEEIRAMEGTTTEIETAAVTIEQPATAQIAEPTSEVKPEPDAVSEQIKSLTASVSDLKETIKALQAANISSARSEAADKPTISDTINSFLQTF